MDNPSTKEDKEMTSEDPTQYEKWDRGKTLMLESLHKPDDRLRGCAHNQKCYHELIEIREQVIEMVQNMSNPRDPDTPTPQSYEYAAHITLSDIARFQRGNSL